MEGASDPNSLWSIKEGFGLNMCQQGQPIKCNAVIRLQHVQTKKFLHSHLFQSPLSQNQETSGFGESDTGDNWRVVCVETTATVWKRGESVRLQHVDTSAYLAASKQFVFNHSNCGSNCPITGQLEVHAKKSNDGSTIWKTAEGYYFAPEN
eukprot:TRINITY_DN1021_c0_g1_i3.p1 TRINITY_DN1021_c0_g1~~TRINITY_DN1021_c0_g1_i3.p1  ORF type:complete len:151 (-),score=39.24 TRINITY_DN1021_c0_g1_i3:148-600(-)